MRVDLFDFDLPPERIALRPVEPRDAARLLVVQPQGELLLSDQYVRDLPDYLQSGDVLVMNDTKVIPARLHAMRHRMNAAAKIEIMLHKRESLNLWRAFARPAKKLSLHDQLSFAENLTARVLEKGEGGDVLLSFDCSGAELDAAIALLGEIPLPPYIAARRPLDAQDCEDYQTIYAREKGAVAAPTAGLHMTENLFQRLEEKGVKTAFVTLHVGAGTFLPVKAEHTDQHNMHSEWGVVTPETAALINGARANGGRVIALGTTSLRLLESAASEDGTLNPFMGDTNIFITPGYRFRCVDALMTNFHLPQSTLFMLVSAFCGLDVMKKAYQHAIDQDYRFYSYGDASLLMRAGS
jgi:S-adenosylmethionine:tRNA ribosyltransferase-isomerase